MDLSHWPLLTIVTFLPLVGAIGVLAIPRQDHEMQRYVALIFSVATFVVSLGLWAGFRADPAAPLWQFEQSAPWIPALGARYHVGIDGVSLLLILLTTLLTWVCVLASFPAITENVRSYFALLLLLETGMLGVFVARDLLLFYVFWEAMLIPIYFIIGVWGGVRRISAAMKFFIYTIAGSLLMLVGILVLYFYHSMQTGVASFDLYELASTGMPAVMQGWLFFLFFLAFAVKVPLFPFHTWQPDAYAEAPTAGTVLLAGVLGKMGIYGFYRYAMPLFPAAAHYWLPLIAALAIIGILYGGLIAIVQRDLKRLLAYSSLSHVGFIVLGLFALNPQGVTGGIVQAINHGITTGALFLLLGMLIERRNTRDIGEYGGIWSAMPSFGSLFMVAMLSSVALPGLNGFVGEFPILLGAFARHIGYGVFASIGMILGAVYLLWMFQRVFQGPLTEANRGLRDLTAREWWVVAPLVLLMFGIGIYPKPLTDRLEPSVTQFLTALRVSDRPIGSLAANPTPGRNP